jgi:hypothetical protein
MMYSLWFKKPVDIYEPAPITPENSHLIQKNNDERPSLNLLQKRARNVNGFGSEAGETRYHMLAGLSNGIAFEFSTNMVLAILGGLLVLCAAYGGIHMTAWNFHFPSRAEKLLWRVCCVIAAVGGFTPPAWLLFAGHFDEDNNPRFLTWLVKGFYNIKECALDGQGGGLAFGITLHLIICIIVLLTPLFLCARVAIIIEAFISLRKVPAGAYASIPWAASIPHF